MNLKWIWKEKNAKKDRLILIFNKNNEYWEYLSLGFKSYYYLYRDITIFFFEIQKMKCFHTSIIFIKHFLLAAFVKMDPITDLFQCKLKWKYDFISYMIKLLKVPLREKCPKTELFPVRIFLYSDWIQEIRTRKKVSKHGVFSGLRFTSCIWTVHRKIRTRKSPFLDNLHAVYLSLINYKMLRYTNFSLLLFPIFTILTLSRN